MKYLIWLRAIHLAWQTRDADFLCSLLAAFPLRCER